MNPLDYEKLSRLQKLAIFLIVVGPECAANILHHFDDAEIEMICREMGHYTMISEDVREKVLDELTPLIGESLTSTLGGMDFARKTLEIARGDYKASLLLNRVGASSGATTTSEIVADIAEMEGRQIYNLIKEEQPQTIAFVLSHLNPSKSSQVFTLLNSEMREEVIERLGTIESTSTELVAKIVNNLGRHIDRKGNKAISSSGGVRAVADILNFMDKDISKSLLNRIEERNQTLGAAVRRKMFSFEDIRRLEAADLQKVLREVDSSHLAIAMKSATEALRENIYEAISKRAAEGLRDEISMLGPVRLKDVEVAQDAIIIVVRRLEEEGAISLDGDEGGLVS